MFDLCSVALQAMNLRYMKSIHEKKVAATDSHAAAQEYNAKVTASKLITTTRRQEEFYKIAGMPTRDVSKEKLLIVGPRNTSELFMAWTHGYSWDNIQGIDLYSTHPKIKVMNMEEMTFSDGVFDVVTMCLTLGYAKDIKVALSEVSRVLKPGGRFAFSSTYSPNETSKWSQEAIFSGEKIRDALHEMGMNIYHHTSFEKINADGKKQTLHAFGAFKEDPSIKHQDRLVL
jgi:SAM-dependent methyltransferase